jgi:hypothetical protein
MALLDDSSLRETVAKDVDILFFVYFKGPVSPVWNRLEVELIDGLGLDINQQTALCTAMLVYLNVYQ